jgi:hypothetical protein
MLAAILVLCRAGGAGATRPPDLPLDVTGECRPQSVEAAGPNFDAMCAAFLNAWTQDGKECSPHAPACGGPPCPPECLPQWAPICPDHDLSLENDAICDPHWLEQAKHLYQIGVRCRESGDLAMARSCFLEVQLLCPRSSFCRLARKQLEIMMLAQIQRAAARLQGETGIRQAGFWTDRRDEEAAPPDDSREQRALQAARNLRRRQCQIDVEQFMVQQAERARRMYHRGERCRQAGELEQALQCFRAAHRLCPQCAFGQRAMKRICDIEQQLLQTPDEGIGEEQETPPKSDEVRELEMLRSTVPLEIYLDEPSEAPTAAETDDKEQKGGVDNYSYEVPPSSTAPWLPQRVVTWPNELYGLSGTWYEVIPPGDEVVVPSSVPPSVPLPPRSTSGTSLRDAIGVLCNSLDVDFDTVYGLRAGVTVGGNVWKVKYGPDGRLSIYVPPLRHE